MKGADGYITKPGDMEDLIGIIRKHLEKPDFT
jgi:DNA-binding response OmpR family regulator